MAAIHKVTATYKRRGTEYRTITATTAGKWLELTVEECGLYDITTMRPVDGLVETAEDKAARDRDRKREKRRMADAADRERELEADRKRARRRRAAEGAKPRAQYLAEAAAKAAERQAAGVSKATFYRRRKTGPSVLVSETSPSVRPLLVKGSGTDAVVAPGERCEAAWLDLPAETQSGACGMQKRGRPKRKGSRGRKVGGHQRTALLAEGKSPGEKKCSRGEMRLSRVVVHHESRWVIG